MANTERKRVAVVGSGCSGLGALWALKNTNHDVHLFEAADRLGGHTNTVKYEHNGITTNVDTGFIVYNKATYPNFINFLKHEKIDTVPTEMTFGVSRDNGAFEWAGTNLNAVFAQTENVFNPSHWRMIFDIIRFNQFALDLLHDEDESEEDPSGANGYHKSHHTPRQHESIGEYLKREGYSEAFRDNYLIPMTAAVWSTGADKCSLEFPAMTLVRFMWNHHLLSTVAARPDWMTLPGGSKRYVDAIMQGVPQGKVHLSKPVKSVFKRNGKCIVVFEHGDDESFDHVILACHGDTALQIMQAEATEEERNILGAFQTTENTAYLHSDLSLMPRRRLAWSSWNIMSESNSMSPSDDKPESVCLTYNMNILQHIPTTKFGDVLVTLNPIHPPSPRRTHGQWTYHHPLYNAKAIQSQKVLPRIQNTRGISYAGAWTKYGFHEDGFSSGLKVAIEHLGAQIPFEFVDSTFSRGRRPVLGWSDWVVRAGIYYVQVLIFLLSLLMRLLEPVLGTRNRMSIRSSMKTV